MPDISLDEIFLPGELDNLTLVQIKTLPDGSTKEVYAL